jgi:WD40 repeat protein
VEAAHNTLIIRVNVHKLRFVWVFMKMRTDMVKQMLVTGTCFLVTVAGMSQSASSDLDAFVARVEQGRSGKSTGGMKAAGLPAEKAVTTGGQYLFTMTSPVPATDEQMARGVAVSPDGNLLVGCHRDLVSGSPVGSAYVFNKSNGSLITTMTNPTPAAGDLFGNFVWATPTKIVIGAPADSDNGTSAGAAYVYSSAGQLLHTLAKPSPAADDEFGWSVNAVGENVLVGCRHDDVGAVDSGSCYMFDSSTGALIRRIGRPGPVAADNFGLSVAGVGTDRVLVGCPGYDDAGTVDAGCAFVFDLQGNLIFTLRDPHKRTNGYMGFLVRSVGIDFLVGTGSSGYAYLFSGVTGNLIREFADPEPPANVATLKANNEYLYSVAVGSTPRDILIGDPQSFVTGATGVVYVFDRFTGAFKFKVTNATSHQNFGVTLAGLSDGTMLAGENFAIVNGFTNAGAAYLYRVSSPAAADPMWSSMP